MALNFARVGSTLWAEVTSVQPRTGDMNLRIPNPFRMSHIDKNKIALTTKGSDWRIVRDLMGPSSARRWPFSDCRLLDVCRRRRTARRDLRRARSCQRQQSDHHPLKPHRLGTWFHWWAEDLETDDRSPYYQ